MTSLSFLVQGGVESGQVRVLNRVLSGVYIFA